ncbi:MAG: hypothetical protein NZ937_02065 [Armatimonadetes bacterium]|nr:hypothetical protein [Armatimonadota bacterium]
MWRWLTLAFTTIFVSQTFSQPPVPNLQSIFPAGAKRGTTLEAVATGNNLQTAFSVWVSGKGVTGEILKVENNNKVQLKFTLEPDAELGERDVRIVTKGGVSNRVRFIVSDLPETKETEPNNSLPQSQQITSLPIVINGTLNPGEDLDCFRVTLKAGETLTAELYAQRLFPYLPSGGGQPGFLDGVLRIRDSKGFELTFADDLRNRPDPSLAFTAPDNGDYILELHDISYRGSNQFVYRLFVSKTPILECSLPLGWQAGTIVRFQIFRLLSEQIVYADAFVPESPVQPLDFWLNLNGQSNFAPVSLVSVNFPVVWETEPNDSKEQANPLTTPVGINGTIYRPEDADWFVFKAQAKQRFVMEIWAWRLNSPVDPVIEVFNPQGQIIAGNDDHPDFLKRPDSYLEWTAPSDGEFFVRVKNRLKEGSLTHAYFLILRPFQPDFSLFVTEENLRIPQGGTIAVPFTVARKEGFNSEVNVTVADLPKGWQVRPAIVPPGQKEGRLTLTAPEDTPLGALAIKFIGSSKIDQQILIREGIGLESVQYVDQQRLDEVKSVVLGVIEPLPFRLFSPEVVEGVVGEKVEIKIQVERKGEFKSAVQIRLAYGLPPNAKADAINIPEGQSEGTLTIHLAANTPVGTFNLIFEGQGKLGDQNFTTVAPLTKLIVKGKQ